MLLSPLYHAFSDPSLESFSEPFSLSWSSARSAYSLASSGCSIQKSVLGASPNAMVWPCARVNISRASTFSSVLTLPSSRAASIAPSAARGNVPLHIHKRRRWWWWWWWMMMVYMNILCVDKVWEACYVMLIYILRSNIWVLSSNNCAVDWFQCDMT